MQFDFTLGASQSQQLDVKGKFFKLVSASGKVRVKTNTGESIDLLPGQGVWGVDYQWLNVQDRTGANNVGTILAGNFDFHDDRISGTVDIVDGGKTRTKAGMAFSAACLALGAANLYTTAQLWNPVDSGKIITISKLIITTDTAGQIAKIGWNNAANGGNMGGVTSKLAGGANSAAKHQNMGLAGEPAGFHYLGVFQTSSTAPFPYQFAEPVVLNPGFGLSVQHGILGSGSLNVNFELIEEPM